MRPRPRGRRRRASGTRVARGRGTRRWLAYAGRALLVLAAVEASVRAVGVVYDLARRPRDAGDSPAAVLCVGDSFTYGIGAPAGESYPAHLGRLLAAAPVAGRDRVVNAGVPGSNSSETADGIGELIERHRPAVVAVMTGHNDANTANSHYHLFTRLDSWEAFRRRSHHVLSFSRAYKLARAVLAVLSPRRPASPKLEDLPPPTEGPEARLAAALAGAASPAVRETVVDRFLASHPDSAYAAGQKIRLLMDGRRPAEALRRSEDLVSRHPEYVPGRLYLARMLWLHRRFDRAFAQWEAVLARDPGNPDAGYGMALKWQYETPHDEVTRVRDELLRYNLERAARQARRHGAKVVILSYPFTDTERDGVRRAVAEEAGGLSVDVSGAFRELMAREDPRRFMAADEPELLAGHCNGRGYRYLAERVYESLSAAGWLEEPAPREAGGS